MRLPPLVLVALLVSGCGEAPEPSTPTEAGPPATVAPTAVKNGPPPAWVETSRGSFWLGYSSFCWTAHRNGLCVDSIAPKCGDEQHTPSLNLSRGDVVRFHLRFDAKEVSLSRIDPSPESLQLMSGLRWKVDGAGPISLFARAKSGGDASYVACVGLT